MLKSSALIVAAIILGGLAIARPPAPCRVQGVPEEARCFNVKVLEVPDDPGSRMLDIRVVLLGARGERPHHEPLLVLQGGPGVPGTLMAATFWQREPLRDRRDLVFIDQRGTGGSSPLSCAFLNRFNFLGDLFPADHLTACRARNQGQANLAAYTNATSAEDLEAVRIALGIEAWSIYAVSFGTRLGQTYARRYPQRVRSVILDGVVPFDVGLTADLAESMEQSLSFVTGLCDRDDECRRRNPDTRGALAALAARLDTAPVSISVTDPLGRRLSGRFGRWELAYAIRGMLYGPLAASLPAWVADARRTGDFSAFARMYWLRTRWVGDSTGVPLHLGVYCSEDLPFIDSVDVLRRARGTLIGARYYQEYRDACAVWPTPQASPEMREPWRSSIPTLLLSGERDPVTPPAYGERVGKHLSRHRHIVVPAGGHADQTPCKTSVLARFLKEGPEGVPTGNCLEQARFPAWSQ
jgi:pimeloyl-ACP methyl ester carboxylesterase